MSSIKDILYFKNNQETLNKWNIQDPLFILGGSGTGKTTLAKLIFKEKKISTNYIDSEFIKQRSSIINYILDIIGKSSITMMFSSESSLNGIIIDDLDVFDTLDNIISCIYPIIKNNVSKTPIILISNNKYLSSNIKKIINISYLIEIPTPSIQRMCKGNYNINGATILRCAQKSNGDWRYFSKLISISQQSDQLINIGTKQNNANILNTTDYIINLPFNIKNLYNICTSDYSLLSLLLYTNIQNILLENNKCILSILNCQQMFDIVEKKIELDWSMIDISILFGCITPLFFIKNINTTKYNTEYTHVFSISTSQINRRNILKKVERETCKSINIISALLYHSFNNDIAYKKCKELHLKEFTLNELQKIITIYYKSHKFTSGNKKILNSFIL